MITFQAAICNIQNATPAPKHIRKRGYMGARETINLDELAKACEKRGVNVNDVIARALTDDALQNAKESGMNEKAQAELAWRIMDKQEASKKAVEHTGDVGMQVILQSSDADL